VAEIFISYARVDRERAQALAGALGREGWSVWWDRDIPPGRTFDDVIEEALAEARCVIVLWTRESIRSEWVKAEASEAARRRILVPVLADQVRPPLEFRRIQSASLIDWVSLGSNPDWSQLCQAVGGLVGQPAAQTAAHARAATSRPAPKPAWRAASLIAVGALVIAVLGWVVAPRPGPAATPVAAAPVATAPTHAGADKSSPPATPDTGVSVPPVPQPLEPRRVVRRESKTPAPSTASAPAVVAHTAVLPAGASPPSIPASTPAPEPITQSPPRAIAATSGAASFDVVYTRGVFRESGRLSVSPDGVRYADSGGASAFDAACGDLRRVQVMTVIVDGDQRMVELHTKNRVHRFTTDSTAARNGLVSALSRTCGAR
jgi:hypothetical protein